MPVADIAVRLDWVSPVPPPVRTLSGRQPRVHLEAGSLNTPDGIAAQARTMLDAMPARLVFQRFHSELFEIDRYQAMEKEERFNRFRSNMMGTLIMKLGAMASEHVFYGENTGGVSHDVETATALATFMVGVYAMGPEPVHLRGLDHDEEAHERVTKRLEQIGGTIMNRASGAGPFGENPLGAVLADRQKRAAAAQILGQAYVTAFALMAANREPIEQIADTLVERKEMHGDEVVDLLNSVGLKRPELALMDDRTWPEI